MKQRERKRFGNRRIKKRTKKLDEHEAIIQHFEKLPEEKKKLVVLYCRCSTEGQRENLELQVAKLLEEMKVQGVEVYDVFKEVAKAKAYATDRSEFIAACAAAREASAVIVATHTNRFLRKYNGAKTSYDTPDVDDWVVFNTFANVEMATILEPDAKQSAVKKFERELGFIGPEKMYNMNRTERHKRLLPEVCGLYAEGMGYQKIATKINDTYRWTNKKNKLNKWTVRNWITKVKKLLSDNDIEEVVNDLNGNYEEFFDIELLEKIVGNSENS